MSTAPTINHPSYYNDYLALRERLAAKSPAWLNDLRAAAWERFDSGGFPTARRGNEPWKYTNVASIARAEFPLVAHDPYVNHPSRTVSLPEGFPASWGSYLFEYSQDPQPPWSGWVGTTLAIALMSGGITEEQQIRRNLARHASIEEDAFVALNTAFISDGALVVTHDDDPEPKFVNVIHRRRSPGTAAHPRTLIIAGRNTNLTVFESYLGMTNGDGSKDESASYFTNAVTEISVGEGAKVTHYRLLDESRAAYHVGTTRVTQARDSNYESGSFAMGCALGRHDLSVLLDGTGAYCSLNGLYLTDNTEHVDNLVSIDHAHPHGTSRLYYKGILDGRSRAVFGGTVLVREDAQKTDAQQTDKNLILSDRAEVDSKPSLLIYADDVKCGHGATAGHIEEDTLFYMRSRGLDPQTASQILIHAFASEIIDTVEHELVREYLDSLFLDTVSGKALAGYAGSSPNSRPGQGGA